MKSLVLVLALAISTSAMGGSGAPDAVSNKAPLSIQNQIEKQVSYPAFAKEYRFDGSSVLTFKILDDGSIKVIRVTGKDPRINKYIESKAKRFKIDAAEGQKDKVYSVKFSFRLLV